MSVYPFVTVIMLGRCRLDKVKHMDWKAELPWPQSPLSFCDGAQSLRENHVRALSARVRVTWCHVCCLTDHSAFDFVCEWYHSSVVARTLAPFDDDELIPVYGFGDATTHDTDVFSFKRGGAYLWPHVIMTHAGALVNFLTHTCVCAHISLCMRVRVCHDGPR